MTIKIRGDEQLARTLDRLPQTVRTQVLEQIAHEAMQPLENDYRNKAHESIQPGVHTRTVDKSPYRATVASGSRHPLAHIFEFGTRLRARLSGAITGRIRKAPFARPAFDHNAERVIRDVGRKLWKVVSRVR